MKSVIIRLLNWCLNRLTKKPWNFHCCVAQDGFARHTSLESARRWNLGQLADVQRQFGSAFYGQWAYWHCPQCGFWHSSHVNDLRPDGINRNGNLVIISEGTPGSADENTR
jgi:hypothetical protein